MIIVLVLLGISILLFITDVFPVDKTAYFLLLGCIMLNLVTPEQAISGFSDPSVVTILCLMILAVALEQNGVISLFASKIKLLANLPIYLFLPLLLVAVGGFSAFVSTTAVVIIFVQLINELAKKTPIDKRRFLMPISFAGILGGSCTLMGTSTNLIVNSVATRYGVEKMQLFDITSAGIIFFVVSLPILLLMTLWVLPKRNFFNNEELIDTPNFLAPFRITEQSQLMGKAYNNAALPEDSARLIRIQRQNYFVDANIAEETLQIDDILWLEISRDQLRDEAAELGLELLDMDCTQSTFERSDLHEIIVLPNSKFLDLTLSEMSELLPEGIAIRALQVEKNYFKHAFQLDNLFDKRRIKVGNRLLVSGPINEVQRLQVGNQFLLSGSFSPIPPIPTYKKWISTIALFAVVGFSAFGVFSILKSAIFGVGICLFSGCITLQSAYRGVNWQVIFLLAGMIPVGIAMQNSGTDVYLSNQLNLLLKGYSPVALVAVIFGFTTLMSGFVSNNATAIVLTPVIIGLAQSNNIPVETLLMAVMFGANFSFYTPVGYQTNAIIYGTGIYQFKHFLMIGGTLTIILGILSAWVINYV